MDIQNEEERIASFFAKLDRMLEVTAKQLDDRFKFQSTAFVKQFPLLMSSLWNGAEKLDPNETIAPVINQGTLGIGFIGLAECLVALIGKHHGESEKAQELGLRIVTYMRDRAADFSKTYQHNYSVLATPAEGLAGRFTKIDRKKFGVLPGITDRDYYTNSFHIPVYYKIGIYDKIKREGPYNALTNGGHITYVEVDGDVAKNEQAFEKIIRCMHDNGVGYGSINHPVDRDPVCGYNGIIDEVCPKCGRKEGNVKFERIRRITGYLVGTLDRFNDAKLEEVNDRVKHQTKDNL